METKIEIFNWDLKWFLSNLEAFQNGLNTSNGDTLDLLGKIAKSIDRISNCSKQLDCNEKTDIVNWVTINEDVFEFQRSIFCRICKKSFPASCRDYILHVAGGEHNSVLAKYTSECDRLSRTPNEPAADRHDNYSNTPTREICTGSSSFGDVSFENSGLLKQNIQNTPSINRQHDSDVIVSDMPKKIKRERESLNVEPIVPYGVSKAAISQPPPCDNQNDSDSDISIRSVRKRTYSIDSDDSLDAPSAKRQDNRSSDRNEIETDDITLPAQTTETQLNDDHCNLDDSKLKALFGDELQTFLDTIRISNEIAKSEKHSIITSDLETLLQSKHESFICQLLGSRVNGTAVTANSTLDVCVVLYDCLRKDSDRIRKLLHHSDHWENVKAKRERIFACHKSTQLECTFTVSKKQKANDELVNCFLDVQPICRRVILCIRNLLNIYDKAGIWAYDFSGYIVSLLVIFNFQITNRLPSALSIIERGQRAGDIRLNRPNNIPQCTDSLSVLLMNFFEFYSKFDFHRNFISVYEGYPIKASICNTPTAELSITVAKMKKVLQNPSCAKLFHRTLMCMPDIFIRGQNVTRMIGSAEIEKFKEFCSKSLAILRNDSGEYSSITATLAVDHIGGYTSTRSAMSDAHSKNSSSLPTQSGTSTKALPVEVKNTNSIAYNESEYAKLNAFFESDLEAILRSAIRKREKFKAKSNATIVADVEKLLKSRFETIACHLIGSQVQCITMKVKSPLDIFLILDGKDYNEETSSKIGIAAVKELLGTSSEWTDVKREFQPQFVNMLYITAEHKVTKVKCNFIVEISKNIIRNDALISCCFDAQPVCRQMVLCIRKSMKTLDTSSNWRNKFSGYIISLLVIFYFQIMKKLPSIYSLQGYSFENVVRSSAPWSDSLIVHLKGFFEFYSKFDFTENVISVYEGCPINHNIREANDETLSNTIRKFKLLLVQKSTMSRFSPKVMCIQDIFIRHRNVTELIGVPEIDRFKEFCSQSLNALLNSKNLTS